MQSSYTFHHLGMPYGFEKSILVYYGQSESAYPFDGWNVCPNIVKVIRKAAAGTSAMAPGAILPGLKKFM